MGNVGVVGAGGVLAHQVFQRPVFRQTSAVGNVQLIFVHTDLDRHAGLILLVAQGVQQGFPQGFFRHKVPLDPLHPLIRDFGPHVLEVHKLYNLVNLFQNGAVDFILIQQVGVRLKIADFYIRAQLPFLRVFAEQQHGCIGQIWAVHQMQLLHQHVFWLIQHAFVNAAFSGGPLLKVRHRFVVHIVLRKSRERQIIPGRTPFAHEEGFQRRAGQNLPGTTAAVVVDALAGNTDGIRRHVDLDVFFAALIQKVDTDNNAHRIPDFIGDVLQQFASVRQAQDIPIVIATNIDFPALRIGVAANPFQIFILPLAFPFRVLTLRHFRHHPVLYVSPGSCKHYTGSCTVRCKRQRWRGCS